MLHEYDTQWHRLQHITELRKIYVKNSVILYCRSILHQDYVPNVYCTHDLETTVFVVISLRAEQTRVYFIYPLTF